MKKIFLIILVFLIPKISSGKLSGSFYIYGIGNKSCGSFIKEQNNEFFQADFRGWLFGYATGLSFMLGEDVLKNKDGPALEIWLKNYCSKNPLNKFSDGVLELIGELRKNNK